MSDPTADYDATFARAVALHQQGRLGDAATIYRELLAASPDDPSIHHNLGLVYGQLRDFTAAEALLRRCIELRPGHQRAHFNLGRTLRWLNRHAEAIESYRAALGLGPTDPEFLIELGWSLQWLGRDDEALQHYRAFLDMPLGASSSFERLYRQLVLNLNFSGGCGELDVYQVCRLWHRHFAAPLAGEQQPHGNDRNPDRRLRIGYVGGDQLRQHTLSAMLAPTVAAHDPAAFQVFMYSDLPAAREDNVSAIYRRHATWRQTAGLSDADFAAQIRADRIDVMIDPVALVTGTRMLALARKPAPIQIAFPTMGPCGGDTIDYAAGNEALAGDYVRRTFTEKILDLPFPYCFVPSSDLPPVAPLPARRCGYITFASVNTLPKLGPRALAAWRRILDAVPNSRLIVKAGRHFDNAGIRQGVLRQFTDAGIAIGRVTFMEWQPDQRAHLEVFNDVDISLDSFPYVGVTTSFDTLAMSVPLVTRVGDRILERYGYAILKAVGFEDGITWSDDEYVSRAVALAGDLDRLEELRRTLRGQLFSSIASDARRVAASLEEAVRRCWRDWCAGNR